jgi:hypothetical protein
MALAKNFRQIFDIFDETFNTYRLHHLYRNVLNTGIKFFFCLVRKLQKYQRKINGFLTPLQAEVGHWVQPVGSHQGQKELRENSREGKKNFLNKDDKFDGMRSIIKVLYVMKPFDVIKKIKLTTKDR